VSELVALVDLGSNAARFALARITPGVGFEVLREARVQSRLASGRPGTLSVAAVERTLDGLERFLAGVRGTHPRVLTVATAAVREARNAERLLNPLRRRTGTEIEVLSGEEEARLGALAALRTLRIRSAIVLDVGGGSLQLTSLRSRIITPIVSLPLGAVRATERYLRHDPPKPAEIRALRDEIRDQVAGLLPVPTAGLLVGLGGTVRALGRIQLKALGRRRALLHGSRLSRAAVGRIRQRLQALPERRRRRVPGLRADRADIILAGTIVVEEIMALSDFRHLTVCVHGVRHGLLIRETFATEVGS
jgi:exopolyphosphatase / guanosine-5'-triphosphate,3'-diphosphate pyrophosphatase